MTAPAPRTAYGRTKLAGERAVLDRLPGTGYVVRTAWLYGAHGGNFVRTMIRLEEQRPGRRRGGRPARPAHLDRRRGEPDLRAGRRRRPAGIYHATSSGQTTWFGLAREVFRLLGADPARVRPVPSSALSRPGAAPGLQRARARRLGPAGVPPIGDWRTALHRAFAELAGRAGGRGVAAAQGR